MTRVDGGEGVSKPFDGGIRELVGASLDARLACGRASGGEGPPSQPGDDPMRLPAPRT